MIRFLGIRREPLHSPHRESDDAMVLQAVADELALHGVQARVLDVGPALEALQPGSFDVVAPMCEALPVLRRLETFPQHEIFVNPPKAVLNCYRVRMVPLLESCAPARFPRTEIRPVASRPSLPSFMDGKGCWVKRGDVHNTCDHDVVHIQTLPDLGRVREDFRDRGIEDMVLQEHVEGDLIKFYGVGPGKWFTWFYHDPGRARKYAFEIEQLEDQTSAGARAVGLEVYGGDAIVTPQGSIHIIDINSWPSFARVRNEASVHIARHLLERVRELHKSVAYAAAEEG